MPSILFVALLTLASPAATHADFAFGDVLRSSIPGLDRVLPKGEEPSGTPLREQELSPFITPIHLPPDFELYHAAGNGPEHLELRYRDEHGSDLLLTQTTLDEDVEVDLSQTDMIIVNDIEVLMLPDPRPGAVAQLIWERDSVRFQLVPISVPQGQSGGLSMPEGIAIIEAVSAVQDTERSTSGGKER